MAKGPAQAPDDPDRFNTEIGKLLRARRNELGVTQTGLARHLGVSQQQIGKYEKGIGRIPADNLLALCQRLQIEPASVFLPLALAGESRAPGFAEADAAPFDSGGMRDRDIAVLVRAFQKIGDQAVRRKVLDLVATLADSGGSPLSGTRKRR